MKYLCSLGLAALVAAAAPAFAQDDYELLDLEGLLSLETSVASLKSLRVQESPGIVTVVTRDEMLSWGARDLIDVLLMVPGFFFGVDVQGVVGVGLRGNWAHEGKLLLLVDGFEMNELDFQTLQFGHHFPVEALERVEIIRGPGSAIYGGTAMLGVVKVTTRDGARLEGGRVSVRYGAPNRLWSGEDQLGHLDATVEAGATHGDLTWSVSGFFGRSVRSDVPYAPLGGEEPYEMGNASERRPMMLNAAIRYKKTQLRVMWDGFSHDSQDAFDVPSAGPHRYRFGGLFAELTSAFELAPGLEITPKVSFRRHQAYWSEVPDRETLVDIVEAGTFLQHATWRGLTGLTVSWDPLPGLNLVFGAEAFIDRGERVPAGDVPFSGGLEGDISEANDYLDPGPVDSIQFFTTSLFGQVLWLNDIVNLTAGGRVEIHDRFGVFAVPRVALTKAFGQAHAKLLFSQAFRTPSLQNASLERGVDPDNRVTRERATVLEAEVGYEPVPGLSFTANGFLTQLDDPIIYQFDPMEGETYRNLDSLTTAGGEGLVTWRFRRGALMASYAYYHALGDPLEDYATGDPASRLAAPRHKLSARFSYEVIPGLVRVTPTLVWLGERWGFVAGRDDAARLDDQVLLGVGVTADEVGVRGLGLGLFAHDLFDQTDSFPQPYAGGHGLLPGTGRQIMLRASYRYDR